MSFFFILNNNTCLILLFVPLQYQAVFSNLEYADAWYNKRVVFKNLGRNEDVIKAYDENNVI
jgi:hypothetical protein